MGKQKIKWHLKGFRAIRNSPGVVEDLERRAKAIARAFPGDFHANVATGKNRARASVVTATRSARKNPNRLLNALESGRA